MMDDDDRKVKHRMYLGSPKDPGMSVLKGINPTILLFLDGIGTIKPTRIRKGMDP